ncbi:hypothetical protein TWF730_000207 [Orbilia blumenaviensis]|uniref:Uncharacterized protein n=1 Tax=Orbilia blumenaviensis TaxID=1796055 RepID=A0AAV9VMX3_9PEZI
MPCMEPSIPDHLRVLDDEIDRELDRLFEELRRIQLTAERLNAELASSRCGCRYPFAEHEHEHAHVHGPSTSSTTEAASASSSSGTRRRRMFPLLRY